MAGKGGISGVNGLGQWQRFAIIFASFSLILAGCSSSDTHPHAARSDRRQPAPNLSGSPAPAPSAGADGGSITSAGPASPGTAGSTGVATRQSSPSTSPRRTATTTGAGSPSQAGGTGSPSSRACPDPRACRDYIVVAERWPSAADNTVRIHYKINPGFASRSSLPADRIVAAIDAAAKTWMEADPAVILVDDGLTADTPSNFNNVIGFGASSGFATTAVGGGTDGVVHGFDMTFTAAEPWQWDPCAPAAGDPCDSSFDPNGGVQGEDLQSIATHEWGHVLGLGHPPNANDDELTMWGGPANSSCGAVCRFYDTLGLGDILGVRSQYPTSAAMPNLYRP